MRLSALGQRLARCGGRLFQRLRQLRWALTEYPYYTRSYAQEGEDVLLLRLLEGKGRGFYVDVGAHHPKRFSNTYLFYQLGWRGINVDATPGSMKLFAAQRPRDINIEAAIACDSGDRTFYLFDEPALNCFDPALAQERTSSGYKLVALQSVRTRRLADLLSAALPPGQPIDFLTVDAEGADLEVLRSNDWRRFRPRFVLVEDLARSAEVLAQSEVRAFLGDQQYRLCAKTLNTLVFQDAAPQPAAAPERAEHR